jgi:hypothetical protein
LPELALDHHSRDLVGVHVLGEIGRDQAGRAIPETNAQFVEKRLAPRLWLVSHAPKYRLSRTVAYRAEEGATPHRQK